MKEDPCPCCGGTGIGEWINHAPTEKGQEAVRCVPCDGVGALSPDYRAGYAQAALDLAVMTLDAKSEAAQRLFAILERK